MIKDNELNNLKIKAKNDLEMIMSKYSVKDVSELNIYDLNEYDKGLFEVASKVLILCYHHEYIKKLGY